MKNFIPAFDLADLTDSQLADEIGKLDIMVKAYTKALDAAKLQFKARGIVSTDGESFTVSVRFDTRATFDSKAVKREMGEDWYKARCNDQMVSVIQIRANAGLVGVTEAA